MRAIAMRAPHRPGQTPPARRLDGLGRTADLLLVEDGQIDRVGHGVIARIVGVDVIAGVVFGLESRGMSRIASHRVEVDDTVESSAGADPLVHLLTDSLTFRGKGPYALPRQECSTHDADAV